MIAGTMASGLLRESSEATRKLSGLEQAPKRTRDCRVRMGRSKKGGPGHAVDPKQARVTPDAVVGADSFVRY